MSGPCDSIDEPLSRVMTLLGKRWTGMIIGTLIQGPSYFGDLRRAIPGLSDRVLNERLSELTSLGLATRTVVDGPPLRVQYELTPDGLAMKPALDKLIDWAVHHFGKENSSAAAAN
jgi:DNA-binding HxlR family transcriptional regulator